MISPIVAHAVYQFIPLAKTIVDLIATDAEVNRSKLAYSPTVGHGKHLAFVDRMFGTRRVDFVLSAHQTSAKGELLVPFLAGGKWIVTQIVGEVQDDEAAYEYLQKFAAGSGGIFHSAEGSVAPQSTPRIDGLDTKKIDLIRKIGVHHAPAIEAMLDHPDITINLPHTPIKYPPPPVCTFNSLLTNKQCF
jgi:hypothetical protein